MFSVTTWNVNGIRARERDLLSWIDKERPDVLCLQETKAAAEQIPSSLSELEGYWTYWHGHKGYSGVALLHSRAAFPVRPRYAHPAFDHETRIVTAELGGVMFASIYVPNGGKDFDAKVRFLDALEAFVTASRLAGTQLVLCGDLNVALEERDVHPSLRKVDQIGQTPAERAQLARIFAQDLVDLSRKFYPDDDRLFSWWAPWRNLRERNIGWRLDYVLASPEIARAAVSCQVSREFGSSDHGPVHAIFDLAPPRARAGEETQPEPAAPAAPPGQLPLFAPGQRPQRRSVSSARTRGDFTSPGCFPS